MRVNNPLTLRVNWKNGLAVAARDRALVDWQFAYELLVVLARRVHEQPGNTRLRLDYCRQLLAVARLQDVYYRAERRAQAERN